MSSPTDHTTYPKSFEARRQLKGLCEEPIDLPISRINELLHFQYNDSYFRKVNTEAEFLFQPFKISNTEEKFKQTFRCQLEDW